MNVTLNRSGKPIHRRGQCPDATPVVIALINYVKMVPRSVFLLLLAVLNAWLAAYNQAVFVAFFTTVHVVLTWIMERKLGYITAKYEELISYQDVCQRDLDHAISFVRGVDDAVDRSTALKLLASLQSPLSPLKLMLRDPLEIR